MGHSHQWTACPFTGDTQRCRELIHQLMWLTTGPRALHLALWGTGFCLGVLWSVFLTIYFAIWLVKPSRQDKHFCKDGKLLVPGMQEGLDRCHVGIFGQDSGSIWSTEGYGCRGEQLQASPRAHQASPRMSVTQANTAGVLSSDDKWARGPGEALRRSTDRD